MYARLTLLEVDTLRIDMTAAVAVYRSEVLPELRAQPGYRGAIVLTTPEGKGVLLSLWASEEDADATRDTGFYSDTLARYLTLFRSPPGREHYSVAYADLRNVAEFDATVAQKE